MCPAGVSPPGSKKTVYTGNIQIPPDIQRDELRPFIILGMDTGGNETLKLDPGKRACDGRGGFERAIDPLGYKEVNINTGIETGGILWYNVAGL